MQEIKWDWYGMWVVDWLTSNDHWEMYDIWEKAYLEANPELEEAREFSYMNDEGDGLGTTLDLLENHYHQSLVLLQESLVYRIFITLQYPINRAISLFWDLESLIRRGKLRHQM